MHIHFSPNRHSSYDITLKRGKWQRKKIPSNGLLPFPSPSCKCIDDVPHSLHGLKGKLPATLTKLTINYKWSSHFDPFFVTVSLFSIS